MEYEVTSKEIRSAKPTLTAIAVVSALVCVISALIGVILSSGHRILSGSLAGLLGVGMILGLFVGLFALHTRLQVELDEAESLQQALLERQQE